MDPVETCCRARGAARVCRNAQGGIRTTPEPHSTSPPRQQSRVRLESRLEQSSSPGIVDAYQKQLIKGCSEYPRETEDTIVVHKKL